MRPYLTGSIAALAIASGLLAQLPTWWQPRGVFSSQTVKDDYALANQGQLKNLAQATAAEMNLSLPGGAGPTLNTLIASWSPPNPQGDDYAVATSGQLKHVTRLFFQRLEDERLARFPNWPSNLPPWFQASPVSDDFAPINLGQLKAAFAILEGKGFSQAVSSNSLASISSSQFGLGWFKDSDADSFADIAEFTQNGHPTNPLIQPVPTLRILSGNRQLIPPVTIAPAPLRVIAERGWIPQAGLSVTFNALAGLTSTTLTDPWLASQTITTAPDGTAQIHWQSGSTAAPDEVTVNLPPPSGPPIVFGLNPPTGPPSGGGNGSGNPPPPVSPPPSTFYVFTSIRIKNASFSGATGTDCREDTDTTETWIEGAYARSTPRPSDDGFDGDADLNQNPSDPGDPRDLNLQHLANTSANVIEKGVDPDSPGAYPLEPYMEESVVNLGTYSPFTLPNKGYYSADDAFLSTPPSTQEGSPTYTSGVLSSMLAATLWGPNLHTGWMGNGRNGISSQSASAFWYSYTWSGSCGTPEPPVDPPEDPPTDPEGEPCCGGSSNSSGGTVTTVSGSGTSVGANHTQVRLQCSHTVTDPAGISRTFLLIQTRTNYTPAGQTSGDPVVTVLGTATLTIPQGQKISTQVSGSASLTYLRNLGGIAYVEMAPPPSTPNTRVELTLLPIEVKVVDRDDPKKTWTDAQTSSGGTVYAGKESGDMLSWKLSGLDSGTFTWKATGPTDEVIYGPTGSGKSEWKIADGDSDTANDWLKWKPGKYKITCNVQPSSGTSFDIDLDQEIGWRTESWMVIGQIVQTDTHEGDAPAVIEYNGGLDLSSPVVSFRRAVVHDIAGWFPIGPAADPIREAVAVTPAPITGKLTEAWFGYWAMVMPHSLTPKGPFTDSSPLGIGNVTEPHRLWMMQHLFNISYDKPSVGTTISEEALSDILREQQYRILHRYQAKFQVEASGAIKSGSFRPLSPLGDQGKTKINIGAEAGEFNPIWDNPAWVYNLASDEPELSPKSNMDGKVSADAYAISSYWSARVGAHGRNANWRLMGMDAPWIFSEIIFEMKPDGTVDTRLRTSVDIAWKDGSVTSGTKQFNNLNIYKRTVTVDGVVQYERKGLLQMEGKLEPFVKSASGVWPEPPLSPEIQ